MLLQRGPAMMSRDDAIPDAVRNSLVATSRISEVKAPRDAASNPLLVGQRRPDVVRLRNNGLVRSQDDLRAVLRDVQGAQHEDESRKGRVRTDGLEPVVCAGL